MNKKKLDIQLFGSGASCTVTVSEVVGSATENTSTFTIKATVKTGSQTYNYSNAYVQGSYSGGASGSLSKQTFSINKSSSVSKSWTVTIEHNADGSLGDITFSIRFYVTDSSNGTTTKTVTPTRIARYFSSTPTLSFSSKTETTITFTWSTSEWCSAMSLSGGGTLSGFSAGTGGTITVSGLANNTPYTHYITCTRSDSGLNSNSNSLTNTTYQYPYINGINANPLLIGNGQYLTIYNPLGRSVTVYMKKDNTSGTQFYSGTTSGTSISFTPNATTMYNSIPNTTEGNAIYYCVYSGQIISTPGGKYQTRGNEVPTFDPSYATISTNLDTFTNDNNTLISGKSTVTVSVNTAADCDNYGSSFSRYVVLQNGATSQQLNSATGSVTLTGGTSSTITIQAYDTRGYHTDIVKTIGEVVNYVNPSISGSTARVDGVGSTVKLFLSGNIYYEKFGSNGDTNQVTTLQYRTSTTTTFSGSYTSISLSNVTYGTGSGNTRSYAVNDYQIDGSYSLGTKYYIEVRMADGNGTNEFAGTSVVLQITSGLIARDVYLKNGSYHTGINGLGNDNYNEYVNGTFHSTGNISTGGTLHSTGAISTDGDLSVSGYVSQLKRRYPAQWIGGRDASVVKQEAKNSDSFNPVACAISTNGDWSIGTLQDNFYITYTSDTDYNNGTNNPNYISFNTSGGYYCDIDTTESEFNFHKQVVANGFYTGGGAYIGGNLQVGGTLQCYNHKNIDANTTTSDFRNQFLSSSYGPSIKVIRNDSGAWQMPIYSAGIAFGVSDTHGYICTAYNTPYVTVGGGNGVGLNWVKSLAFADTFDVFSSNKTQIGTWINGAAVYRKVVTLSGMKKGNNWPTYDLGGLNTLIHVYGAIYINGVWQPISRTVTDGNGTYGIGVGDVYNTYCLFQIGSSYSNVGTGYLVFEYT